MDTVIVDSRYSDSLAFAAVLDREGGRVIDTQSQDLGLLWYGALGAAFAAGPQRLAGLTPHSDLFICETFARERGARLIYQGAHDCRGVNGLTHSLQLGDGLPGLGAVLNRAGRAWPTQLARQLGRAGGDRLPRSRETVATRTARAPDNPGMLFSWLIARPAME